jgi:hypothetical protein
MAVPLEPSREQLGSRDVSLVTMTIEVASQDSVTRAWRNWVQQVDLTNDLKSTD